MRAALGLYSLVLPLVLLGGSLTGSAPLGIMAVQWLCIAAPVVVLARVEGGLGTLRVTTRFAPGALAGAVLVGLSAWLVIVQLVVPVQEAIAPMPQELVRQLEEATTPDAAFILVLLAFVVTPAICEELLCRGALLHAFLPRLGPTRAVLLSSLLFALLHLSFYRLLPTLLLGVLFAVITLRSGSVVPAMVAHALNNLSVVLVGHLPALRAALEAQPLPATGVAVGALTFGLWLATRKR